MGLSDRIMVTATALFRTRTQARINSNTVILSECRTGSRLNLGAVRHESKDPVFLLFAKPSTIAAPFTDNLR
jgi:hypothetical protein